MKKIMAMLFLVALAVQGCSQETRSDIKSDMKEAGNDLKRSVQDATD